MIPMIDIGGRWVPTNFIRRGSGDAESEIGRLLQLTEDLGEGEGILIYPEGTRDTARSSSGRRRNRRDASPRSRRWPTNSKTCCRRGWVGRSPCWRDAGERVDVVFCAHVGFDGFETVGDIWSGGLVGRTIWVQGHAAFQRV